MKNYQRVIQLSEALVQSVKKGDAHQMIQDIEALERAYQSEFGNIIDSFEAFYAYCKMRCSAALFFAHNNFYNKVHENFHDVIERYDACLQENRYSNQQYEKLKEIIDDLRKINTGVRNANRNKTVNRLDARCRLCRELPANNIGSHMVPNFLAHPSFSWNEKGKRDREVADLFCINNSTQPQTYYGSEVPLERIKQAIGHEPTDEDIERNINFIEFDNEFCVGCEKRFSVVETMYAEYYHGHKKNISPRVAYLFWLTVLWRMSIGGIGVCINMKEELELRELLDKNLLNDVRDILKSTESLGNWQYAMFRAQGLKYGDKGTFGTCVERAPYVIACNDCVLVFYPNQPSDKDLQVGPIHVKREQLNNWQTPEKVITVDRRWFWNVRDWVKDLDFAYRDSIRGFVIAEIREYERTQNKPFSKQEIDRRIKQKRLETSSNNKLLRLRKADRIATAYERTIEAKENGEVYDPFTDEEIFITPQDMHNYFEDLAGIARYEGLEAVQNLPYYEEARAALPDADKWKSYEAKLGDLLEQLAEFERTEPICVSKKPGRNALCPCGSGLKYKKCCGNVD